MRSTIQNIEGAINDYLLTNPDGVDVTAHVLDRIGKEDFDRDDVAPARKTLEQAKQDMGKLVKELLDKMFHIVEHLGNLPLDKALWPRLAPWVSSYTRHKVDTTRRRF
jgi:hypothetical protein